MSPETYEALDGTNPNVSFSAAWANTSNSTPLGSTMETAVERLEAKNNKDYEAAPLGLYINKENELLPLFSIDIKSVIHEKFAQVQLIQKYYNPTMNI